MAAESEYRYSPLSHPKNIRILQIGPYGDDPEQVRCRMSEFGLWETDRVCLYEALSYVWGDNQERRAIMIDDQIFNVTRNLYAALLRLQDCKFPRFFWIDAISIDQSNMREKESQIPLMAEIYAKASRVIIWLGEANDSSDEALSAILGAMGDPTKVSMKQREAIQYLLQRPWFKRIWILQEVAAARQALIMCGSMEIDSLVFCLGMESQASFFDLSTIQGVFLVREALARPRQIPSTQKSFSLNTASFGELLDMFHAHEATIKLDKIFALLGMCSDDLSESGLEPNYSIPWGTLMRNALKYIFRQAASIDTWDDQERAVINTKGCILGKVFFAQKENISTGSRQRIQAYMKNRSERMGFRKEWAIQWYIRTTVNSVQPGDLICFVKGTSRPIIARPRDHQYDIISIAAPTHMVQTTDKDFKWPELNSPISTKDLQFVWDWGVSLQQITAPENNVAVWIDEWLSEQQHESLLDHINSTLNAGLLLIYIGLYQEADTRFRDALNHCELALQGKDVVLHKQQERLYLPFSVGIDEDAMMKLLLEGQSEINFGEIPAPRYLISYAAESGNDHVVKLILKGNGAGDWDGPNGQVKVLQAAKNGQEAVVRQLLRAHKILSSPDSSQRTPATYAAQNEHQSTVEILKEAQGRMNIGFLDLIMALTSATKNGHEEIVKLLLDFGALINQNDGYGRNALSYAAEKGLKSIVSLLLEKKASVSFTSADGKTALMFAAEKGHEAIVEQLLAAGASLFSSDHYGRTPLSYACENGNETIVKRMISIGAKKFFKDSSGRTATDYAVENEHDAIVELLKTVNL